LKYRYSFLLFLAMFLLQSTIMNHFAVLHMAPNLILCLVVIFSFLYEGYHAIIFGILFGLIIDVCFGEIIGVASLSFFAVALTCLEMKRYLYKDSRISVMIVTTVGSAVYSLFFWGIYRMLGSAFEFIYILKMEGVVLAYNIVVTLIIYQLVSRSVIKHRGDRYMYRGNLQEARSLYRS
jgi:rod shape-determining protein MreD